MNFSKSAVAAQAVVTRRMSSSSSSSSTVLSAVTKTTKSTSLTGRSTDRQYNDTIISASKAPSSLLGPVSVTPSSWFSTTRTSSSSYRRNDFDGDQPMTTPIPNLQDQQHEPTLLERSNKNIFQRMYDKYSFSQQTNRILMAESFLQAAISQASDP
jgi:hypothetical protein